MEPADEWERRQRLSFVQCAFCGTSDGAVSNAQLSHDQCVVWHSGRPFDVFAFLCDDFWFINDMNLPIRPTAVKAPSAPTLTLDTQDIEMAVPRPCADDAGGPETEVRPGISFDGCGPVWESMTT